MENPFDRFLNEQGFVVLDGGLATELERRGADLRDSLWSARVLLEQPALIRELHLDYYRAGADVAITSSYQATFQGLAARGLDRRDAETVLRRSVTLAQEARAVFWSNPDHRIGRSPPLVAGSIGPYGAFLHDGSEYKGDYGLTKRELVEFHRERLRFLTGTGADLLAIETIPSRVEAEALLELLGLTGRVPVMISFSCRDDCQLSDGSSFAECVALVQSSDRVVAAGLNCTAPRWVAGLLRSAAPVATKPLVAYPNSGERYDAGTGGWLGGADDDPAAHASEWFGLGARILGGCCRTGPETIAAIRRQLRTVSRESG